MKNLLLNLIGNAVASTVLGMTLLHSTNSCAQSSQQLPNHWRPVLFDQRMYWVGVQEPSTNDMAEITALIKAFAESKPDAGSGLIEQYVNTNPGSGWVPSLDNFLAEYYMVHGQFTPALELWQSVWQTTKQYTNNQEGKLIADYALVHWTRLLASLGRYDTLTALFKETKGRVLDRGPLSQMILRTKEAYTVMGRNPGISYRCGTLAMLNVCHALYGTNFNIHALFGIQSPTNGFTLEQLEGFSDQLNLGLIMAKLPGSAKLIVPSVVNWRQHHYGAIVAFQNGLYTVDDPTMAIARMMTADEIKAEASGYYLVPAKLWNSDCLPVSTDEAEAIYGKGNPNFIEDNDDQPCNSCPCLIGPGPGTGPGSGPNAGSSCSCVSGPPLTAQDASGMPQWGVSEPYINVWLQDEPLGYQPAYGPRVSFRIYYRDRAEGSGYSIYSTMGVNWTCDWLQIIEGGSGYPIDFYLPGGGYSVFFPTDTSTNNTYNDYYNNVRMTSTTDGSGALIHAEVQTPDGGKSIYDARTNSYGTLEVGILYLSEKMDAQGNALTFHYMDGSSYTHVLTNIIDATGRATTLGWETDVYGDHYLTNVTDPFGRSASIHYDTSSVYVVTNITDVAGNSSSMAYEDEYGMLTNLVTPYGATSFYRPIENDPYYYERAVLITEPTGGQHLYYFYQYSTWLDYPDSEVPTNTPYGTLDTGTDSINSYYWGPRQYPLLSADFRSSFDFTTLTTNDFLYARLRHWLGGVIWYGDGTHSLEPMDTLSLEQDPSPDGTTLGQATWYDYPNKPQNDWRGSQILPGVTARVMPDGSTFYVWDQRDAWGHLTNEITHWVEDGQDEFQTNVYVYSTNGFDLLENIRADGVTNAAYGYDNWHRVLFMTNALGEVTGYSYNTNGQLASIIQPNGLVTTNRYGSDSFLATQIVTGYSTNSYAYSNALIYTQIDGRGLATTNTWDALNRLTSTWFPDGTSISNQYTFLDITGTKDRLGNWTHYGYDALRRKIAETNALGAVTLYNYCDCGSLDSIEDAMSGFTYFYYDNQGNLTNTLYADSYSMGRRVDLLHRLVSTRDSSGYCVTNTYNNHGLLMAVSNAFGRVRSLAYDVDDRVTNSIDANGVSVTNTYDNLSRIRTRGYPDGGVEKWGYAPDVSGPTSYTNQIGNVTLWAYDSLNRKTNETILGVTTNSFSYNGAGDLLTLTDGKADTTAWGYDSYGRVTNKVDAANDLLFVYKYDPDNRLTNRWSAAKGNTGYGYDAVGNLTHVAYPASPAITLTYDALNRLTDMVDAVGTTVYGYDAAGQLLSEDGPWPDDTVSYSYQNRLRESMSVAAPNTAAWTQEYGYDAARRLDIIMSPAGEFDYTLGGAGAASPLIRRLLLPNDAYATNSYDSVARLSSTALYNSGNTDLDSYAYSSNQAGQRTNVVRTAGDYVAYTYDNAGELLTAVGREPSGTLRSNDRLTYAYDAAGNLLLKRSSVATSAQVLYGMNNLNEITNSAFGYTNALTGWSGTIVVSGSTTSPANNVTVNGTSYSLYGDDTFATYESVTNGINTFTAIASDALGRFSTNTARVNVVVTNHTYSYDLNGNLLGDGTRGFAYDDENELISVWTTNVWRNDFVYDGKMRRRIERDYSWNGSSWLQTNEVHYIYDGNVVIQERNTNNLPTVTYTRGTDLSGNLQGAGGIGGLLARTDNSKLIISDPFATAFYHSDGNGNLTYLIYQSQTMAAKYLYDPYGNMLAMSGPLAVANTYRFSSKEWNANSDLYYYLYRFYDPNLQRWLNRDPNQEWGEINLYGIDENDPDDFIDPDGEAPTSQPSSDPCAKERHNYEIAQTLAITDCALSICGIEGGPFDYPLIAQCAAAQAAADKAAADWKDCHDAHKPHPKPPPPKPPQKPPQKK